MDSPQKTGLDTGQTISFGGHPTLISATSTDLAILGVVVIILHFSVHIWILLKKPAQTQVKPLHLEEVTCKGPVALLCLYIFVLWL